MLKLELKIKLKDKKMVMNKMKIWEALVVSKI